MNTPISFRLRKELDADLITAVNGLGNQEVVNLCRDGLRLMLGIHTTKKQTVIEQPLHVPTPRMMVDQTPRPIPGKPAVFIPTKRG